jgi:hypothetical protein
MGDSGLRMTHRAMAQALHALGPAEGGRVKNPRCVTPLVHCTVTRMRAATKSPIALGLLLASAILAGPPAHATQRVWLNFGSATAGATKTDQTVYVPNAGNKVHFTMTQGERRGFRPTDLGFADNDTRAAIITALKQQVIEDFKDANGAAYDISVVATAEAPESPFTEITIQEGSFPNITVLPGSQIESVFDFQQQRITWNATGANSEYNGYYYDMSAATPTTHKPDGTQVTADLYRGRGGSVRDIYSTLKGDALGHAQRIDKGNEVKNDKAWIYAGVLGTLPNLTAQKRQTEMGNVISHELAHLLGVEHGDTGNGPSIMRAGKDGDDKAFHEKAHEKLKSVLGMAGEAAPRIRKEQKGDTDQHGTSRPEPPSGEETHDLEEHFATLGSLAAPQTTDPPYTLYLSAVGSVDPGDGPDTDRFVSNGSTVGFTLNFGEAVQGELHGAWIELTLLNVADVLGGSSDFKVFVDGVELVAALNGIDQRFTDPDSVEHAHSDVVTLPLDDYLSETQIRSLLADGVLVVTLQVRGASSGISIDSVIGVVSDDFPASGPAPVLGMGPLLALVFLIGVTGTVVVRARQRARGLT